jgi:protein ImuB
MSDELYACVCAPEFPAQALLRLRTELQSEPVAVIEGRAPLEIVCSLNRAAHLKGAVLGMTRLEAEGISDLRLLARSVEVEAAVRAVLLEYISQFSPRIEDASAATASTFVLDIAGTGLLFGPPETLAKTLRAALTTAGFRASISVSANFHTARLKAATSRGITVIPEGQEATVLAKLPLAVLNLEENHAETFAIWGIRTLGELAALPEVDLIARLGQQAKLRRNVARGVAAHPFQPIEAEFTLKEFFDFETPVEEMDSLLFIGARMIDCLVARASARALSLATLTVDLALAGERQHKRVIRPALPSIDRKFLLKLLQLAGSAAPYTIHR